VPRAATYKLSPKALSVEEYWQFYKRLPGETRAQIDLLVDELSNHPKLRGGKTPEKDWIAMILRIRLFGK